MLSYIHFINTMVRHCPKTPLISSVSSPSSDIFRICTAHSYSPSHSPPVSLLYTPSLLKLQKKKKQYSSITFHYSNAPPLLLHIKSSLKYSHRLIAQSTCYHPSFIPEIFPKLYFPNSACFHNILLHEGKSSLNYLPHRSSQFASLITTLNLLFSQYLWLAFFYLISNQSNHCNHQSTHDQLKLRPCFLLWVSKYRR